MASSSPLGTRLHECCALLLKATGVSARDVFGEIDAMKLRSWLPCRGCRRAEHRAIADAVLARDADRACDLLAEHFEGTTRINLRAEGMALGGDGAR